MNLLIALFSILMLCIKTTIGSITFYVFAFDGSAKILKVQFTEYNPLFYFVTKLKDQIQQNKHVNLHSIKFYRIIKVDEEDVNKYEEFYAINLTQDFNWSVFATNDKYKRLKYRPVLSKNDLLLTLGTVHDKKFLFESEDDYNEPDMDGREIEYRLLGESTENFEETGGFIHYTCLVKIDSYKGMIKKEDMDESAFQTVDELAKEDYTKEKSENNENADESSIQNNKDQKGVKQEKQDENDNSNDLNRDMSGRLNESGNEQDNALKTDHQSQPDNEQEMSENISNNSQYYREDGDQKDDETNVLDYLDVLNQAKDDFHAEKSHENIPPSETANKTKDNDDEMTLLKNRNVNLKIRKVKQVYKHRDRMII